MKELSSDNRDVQWGENLTIMSLKILGSKTFAEECDQNSTFGDISSTIAVQAVLAMAPTLRCYYAHSQLCWSLMGGAIKGNESHSTFLYCFLGSRA